jgi:anaerobic magnesium-protoporphyrin IX monomethyl ester cyclase
MNLVIANGPRTLDNGKEVILFPSRWDSGVTGVAPFQFYPYELAYLSALLKRELPSANVTMLDGNLEGWGGEEYIQQIASCRPDVLICECSALTYPTMTRVMRALADCDTILCGPMASDAPRAHADGWQATVSGEYELKVLKLLGGSVPPEAYTDAGLINLDWLPWPEDEDVDRSRYYENNHYAKPAVIQLYATRGCPLSCTFCVVPTYYGGHGKTSRSHRCRDVGDVCAEIEYLAKKYPNFHGCYFNEEAHSANPEWLAAFCEELIRRGLNKYQYDAMCGMWSFTRELVELCARAGYKQIRFGVESTSEAVGKAIKKTIHKAKTEEFLGWLKAAGIGAYITLQVGAMGSTEASDRATIADAKEWIRRGLVQKWQISTSTPQPSTPFYQLAKDSGWLTTDDINEYDGMRAVVSFPDYPAARIQSVRNGAGL